MHGVCFTPVNVFTTERTAAVKVPHLTRLKPLQLLTLKE